MSAAREPYRVHDGPVRIPVVRRQVSRVAVSPSQVTLELTTSSDPVTSTIDLFAVEGIDLGNGRVEPHRILGSEAAILLGLLRRRVTACLAADGILELRLTGSARVRSGDWSVGLGDGRHWTPHPDRRIAEWRPVEMSSEGRPPGRRPPRSGRRLDTANPLPLAGQQLEAIGFLDDRLDLQFEAEAKSQPLRQIDRLPDIEVDLARGVLLGDGPQVIDAGEPASAAPLLGLVGVATTGGSVDPDGTLEIRFANGATLTAGPGEPVGWGVNVVNGEWYRTAEGGVLLVEPEEVRPLMAAARARLVRAYLEYSATDRPDLFWTSDRIRDLIWHAPDDAYEVIRELVRLAPSPYVLGIVAAGPLEDLLSDWGERYIDRLEADARADPKLMAACAEVWKLYMPDAVWTRLRSLVGSGIERGTLQGEEPVINTESPSP